jgi:hypothetical protein
MQTQFSKIKKGEIFHFKGKKKSYLFLGGGKVRGYKYQANDDINAHYSTKTDRIIEV